MYKKFLLILSCAALIFIVSSANSAQMALNFYPAYFNQLDFENYIIRRNPKVNKAFVPRIARAIIHFSNSSNLDALTVLAMIAEESAFYRNVTGPSGEICLMQIMPNIWIYNNDNSDNLVDAGILKPVRYKKGKHWYKRKPENALWNINRCIAAGTHILTVKRRECQLWDALDRLRGRGYHTIQECMIRRYNGGSKTLKYYRRVASTVGDYYFYTVANGLQNPITAMN